MPCCSAQIMGGLGHGLASIGQHLEGSPTLMPHRGMAAFSGGPLVLGGQFLLGSTQGPPAGALHGPGGDINSVLIYISILLRIEVPAHGGPPVP